MTLYNFPAYAIVNLLLYFVLDQVRGIYQFPQEEEDSIVFMLLLLFFVFFI